MTLLRNIARGLRSLFRKERVEGELDEELRGFLEMASEAKMKQGMSRKDALRTVRLERGSLEVTKEVVRSGGWESLVETSWQDLRYGARMLRKNPGSTAAVVIALALGIGLNTTVFTFVNALLLRPPAGVKAPDRLLEVWIHNPRSSGAEGYLPLTYPDYLYYRDHSQSFGGMLAFDIEPDFWAPTTMVEQITGDKGRLSNWHGHWLIAIGRLKPEASVSGARAEVSVLEHQIELDHPDLKRNLDATVFPATLIPGPYRIYVSAFTALFMAVFGLVLLIALAMVARFLLARATGRTREMAVRSALGAGRGRLIRQMLV